jgi:hypothetical protein
MTTAGGPRPRSTPRTPTVGREVVTNPHARYFGAELNEETLVPGSDAILAETRYSGWPGRTVAGR